MNKFIYEVYCWDPTRDFDSRWLVGTFEDKEFNDLKQTILKNVHELDWGITYTYVFIEKKRLSIFYPIILERHVFKYSFKKDYSYIYLGKELLENVLLLELKYKDINLKYCLTENMYCKIFNGDKNEWSKNHKNSIKTIKELFKNEKLSLIGFQLSELSNRDEISDYDSATFFDFSEFTKEEGEWLRYLQSKNFAFDMYNYSL